MAEMLNCPFCNNDVNEDEGCFQVSGFRPPSTPAFAVRCGNPSCNAEVTATSRDEAIAAWNRRTPPQAAGGEPAQDVGRITGWRMQDGVQVFPVKGPAHELGVPEQLFMRYDRHLELVTADAQEFEKVVRAWRNRFISERTGHYQTQGQCYEEAISNAEYDANCYAEGLVLAGITAPTAQPTGANQ